jgi:hypothetical protein
MLLFAFIILHYAAYYTFLVKLTGGLCIVGELHNERSHRHRTEQLSLAHEVSVYIKYKLVNLRAAILILTFILFNLKLFQRFII